MRSSSPLKKASCHSREGGNPETHDETWIPAYASCTVLGALSGMTHRRYESRQPFVNAFFNC